MKLLYISILFILGFSCNTGKETTTPANPYYEGLFIHEQDMELLAKMNHGKILGVPNVMLIKLINDKEAILVYEIIDKAHFDESIRRIYTKLVNDKNYMTAQKKSEWISNLTYTYMPQYNDSIVFLEKKDECTIEYSGKIIDKSMALRFTISVNDTTIDKVFIPDDSKDATIQNYIFYPVVSE